MRATAAYLALITALAHGSGIGFVLFPELGALGSLVVSDLRVSWARSPLRLAIAPFLTALPGVLITRSLPYGPLAVTLDVAVCLLVIGALRSPIVPALSAGVLPLALGITSWQYPLAILAGTGGLALLVFLRPRLAIGFRRSLGRKSLGDLAGSMPSDASIAFAGLAQGPGGAIRPAIPSGACTWAWPGQNQHGLHAFAPGCQPWRWSSPAARCWCRPWAGCRWPPCWRCSPWPCSLHLARLTCPPADGLALLPFVIPTPPQVCMLLTLTGTAWLLLVAVVELHRARERRRCGREWNH